jgi:hypothetical protein
MSKGMNTEKLTELNARLFNVENFLFITACIVSELRTGKRLDVEVRRNIAEILSVDFDSITAEFKKQARPPRPD